MIIVTTLIIISLSLNLYDYRQYKGREILIHVLK